AIEVVLRKAAQVLGILTQELGIAVGPSVDAAVLEQLELVSVSSERLLLVLVLSRGAARTIFIEVPIAMPLEALAGVALVLNERLRGLTLREIRTTLRDRLRDTTPNGVGETELLNIFLEEADHLFEGDGDVSVVLGSTQPLTDQPEFHSNEQMRTLL